MNNPGNVINSEQRRKRLGQYFTHEKLVGLLIALTDLPKNITAIDPMAGTGNMLVGLLQSGYPKANLFGIEIDPVVGRICRERVDNNNIQIGNAFQKETYEDLANRVSGWDLVITNPPYVRYQALKNEINTELGIPNARAIRQDLLLTIEQLSYLDALDQRILKILAQSYSGLSDMAVPSWLLCASLVKPGGKLAIVVPDTWLHREYAAIVQYLLLKWFVIEFVVEDVNSVWFPEAQVKTNLLIAKRRRRRESIFTAANDTYNYIKIYAALSPRKSTCKRSEQGDEALKIKSLLGGGKYRVHTESMSTMLSNVSSKYSCKKWFQAIEKTLKGQQLNLGYIPVEIMESLEASDSITYNMAPLRTFGVSIGQGLRTGANKFFYLNLLKKEPRVEYLKTNNYFGNKVLKVPSHLTRVVVRKQSDLPRKLTIALKELEGRVLYIKEAITLRDQQRTSNQLRSKYQTLNQDLEDYINLAENTPLSSKNPDQLIPDSSAVKPNQRLTRTNGEESQRFWYMLPPLVKRHIPDFCIPRVNHESPQVYMLLNEGVVVDANFSTIWLDDQGQQHKLAYFALLNSTWFKACLECICTVMGGGALKVEATHLKKTPLPVLSGFDYRILQDYGETLAKLNSQEEIQNLRKRIDTIILRRIFKENSIEEKVVKLEKFVQQKVAQRNNL